MRGSREPRILNVGTRRASGVYFTLTRSAVLLRKLPASIRKCGAVSQTAGFCSFVSSATQSFVLVLKAQVCQ